MIEIPAILPIKHEPVPPEPEAKREFRRQAQQLKSMPLAGIECRANGHHWQAANAQKITYGWWVRQRCPNCGSFRQQWLDRYGQLARNSIINYSHQFEQVRGLGRNTGIRKGAARVEAMTRNMLETVTVAESEHELG